MRFRIQGDDDASRTDFTLDGPLVVAAEPDAPKPSQDVVLWLSDDEAHELCLELAYQIMMRKHKLPGK